MDNQQQISEDWLRDSGFKYYQGERQPHKHWVLWLGWGNDQRNGGSDDIGVEVTAAWWFNRHGEKVGDVEAWNCWIVSHSGSRKCIHVRYLYTVVEVKNLVEALTGQQWNPDNHMYGNCYYPDMAKRFREKPLA